MPAARPARARRAGLAAAFAVLLLGAAMAQAAPRIGLLTMGPGAEYWSRFGHNAILVAEPGGRQTVYNYGWFDFDQPDFLQRFVQGRMLYRLAHQPLQYELAAYREAGRGVDLQWLAIEPEAARELARFLAWNARPENADYRYDYFFDNCSTRVRDALDRALDGRLRDTLAGDRGELTLRSESQRLAAGVPWLWLGIDAGLGPTADRPLDRYQQAFVPHRLAEAIAGIRLDDGRPLVVEARQLVPQRLDPPRAEPPRVLAGFAATGLVLALALAALLRPGSGRGARLAGSALAGGLWLLAGLGGLLLLYLWALTDHAIVAGNENLLLFQPLALALLPACAALARGARPPATLRALAGLGAGLALLALALEPSPWPLQANGHWIALWLPIHLLLGWRMLAQPRPPA